MNTSQPEVLFSMSTGYAPLTNLLGAGDPNVHWIDGRWWMFFGAFRSTLRNNIFAATLAPGEPLHEGMRWRVHTHPSKIGRASCREREECEEAGGRADEKTCALRGV